MDESRPFLKDCKHPENVINKIIFNAKLPGLTAKSEKSENNIPFVTTSYPNIVNKSFMQTVKSKFQNIREEHLQSIYKDTNFILSLKQSKTFV